MQFFLYNPMYMPTVLRTSKLLSTYSWEYALDVLFSLYSNSVRYGAAGASVT